MSLDSLPGLLPLVDGNALCWGRNRSVSFCKVSRAWEAARMMHCANRMPVPFHGHERLLDHETLAGIIIESCNPRAILSSGNKKPRTP